MKKLSTALLILFFTHGYSQENKTLNDSLYNSAIQLRNDGKFEESITTLDKISIYSAENNKKNIEKSRVLYYDQKFDLAAELLYSLDKEKLDRDELHNFYLILGNILDNTDKKQEALSLYNEASLKFPYSYLIYYNRAVIYSRLDKTQEAINDLENSIKIYPNYYRAHYLMGLLAFKNGNLSEGILAMTTSILLDFNGNSTEGTIKTLNYYLSKKQEEIENKIEIPGQEVFESSDNIIKKQFALHNSYKLKSPIDITYIRQLQALLSELQKTKEKKGFYAERYIDFYNRIWQNNLFEIFTYKLFKNYDNAEMQKIILKKNKELEKFNNWMFTNITQTICTKNRNTATSNEIVSVIDEDGYIGYGKLVDDKKQGFWTFTNPDGSKYLEGTMKDNAFNGEIQFFYRDGNKNKTINYSSGIPNGKAYFYYPNGNKLSEREFLNNDEINKQTFYYRLGGGLKSYYSYKNGKISDKEEFLYNNGTLKSTITFSEGNIVSDFQEFFPNGSLKTKTQYGKGKLNGIKEEFYPDNSLFNHENYIDGNLSGECYKNFQNGDLYNMHKIENNNVTYYKEMFGKQKIEERFYNGNRLIKQILYSNDLPMIEYLYEGKDGFEHLYAYKTFDENGKFHKEFKVKLNESFIIKLYNDNILLEGKYNLKGEKDGEWKYYNALTGLLESHTFYDKNIQTDKYEEFYTNGVVKTYYKIKNGLKHGKYVTYFKNGQIENESFYSNDEQNGEVKYFHKNGKLKSIYFVINDAADGLLEKYSYRGELEEKSIYIKDELIKSTFYYKNSPVSEVDYQKNGVTKYFKKNIMEITETNVLNGVFEGDYSIKTNKNEKIFTAKVVNGNKYGASIFYNPNGTITVEANYLNNQTYGKYIKNNLEGKLYWKGNYWNDTEFGITEKYFHEGFKYLTTEMYNNQKNGEEKYFGNNGEEILKLYFSQDILIAYQKSNEPKTTVKNGNAIIKTNYKNGKPALEINYKNGLLDGNFKFYADNGANLIYSTYKEGDLVKRQINYLSENTYSIENFSNNDFDGKTSYFFPNGKLKIEAEYANDNLNGYYKEYDANGKIIVDKKYEDDILIENK